MGPWALRYHWAPGLMGTQSHWALNDIGHWVSRHSVATLSVARHSVARPSVARHSVARHLSLGTRSHGHSVARHSVATPAKRFSGIKLHI